MLLTKEEVVGKLLRNKKQVKQTIDSNREGRDTMASGPVRPSRPAGFNSRSVNGLPRDSKQGSI